MFNGKVRELDMTTGSLAKKILIFAAPLILTSVLQLLYNAADVIVVGRYAGSRALAAVGSNTSLISLLVNLFIGFSVGVNVNAAKYYGAQNSNGVSDTVHTSMLLALICGVSMGIFGFIAAKELLIMMSSPEDVLELSALYLRIYFVGMPGLVIYNFGAALLRAAGDTNRPLIFLSISGVLNIVLNLLFVIVFKMDVAGVALATTISQYVSTILVVMCLIRTDTYLKLSLKKLRLRKKSLLNIIKVGLPAGIQGILFSISNVLIQSTVNSFGSVVMAGNAAALSIEGFSYVSMEAVSQSAITAVGQNVGARKYQNISRILKICLLFVLSLGVLWGVVYILFGEQLISIYAPGEPDVIAAGKIRLDVFGYTYFTWGLMNTFMGMLRGMGYSTTPTVVSVLGICGLRIVWIYTFFAADPTLLNLYISYPASWVATLIVVFFCYIIAKQHLIKKVMREDTAS